MEYGEQLKPFQILGEIKSVSFATVSGGQPQVRIIDVISEGEIYRIDGEDREG